MSDDDEYLSADDIRHYFEKLGLTDGFVRRFEKRAINVLQLFPNGVVERTRDAIQINIRDERGIVLLLTPEALEVRLPSTDWTMGSYGPAPSSTLLKRILWDKVTIRKLKNLCQEALSVRDAEFIRCRFCGEEFPPGHRHGDVCHGCAERHLGIVH